jgi:hypothetical protein
MVLGSLDPSLRDVAYLYASWEIKLEIFLVIVSSD